MTPIVAGDDQQPQLAGRRERQARRRHQRGADDQHPPPADPIGARRERQRHDRVADSVRVSSRPVCDSRQADADEIEHQHDRQRAVREQPDEPGGEQQPARRASAVAERSAGEA